MRRVCLVSTLIVVALTSGIACGDDYPRKPVRIVTSEAGGNGDFHARFIAQGLTAVFPQPVIVDNRGGTIIVGQTVLHSQPDGYTLLVQGSSFWVGPLLQQAPYDVVRDFAPITTTSNSPNVLVVHPALGVKSVKELIALAKAKPKSLNYASAAVGSAQHIAGELFISLAGLQIAAVPYKSEGPGLSDVIGGRVPIMFPSAIAASPHVKAGRLLALGVGSTKPSPLYPDVPTIAATLPGYEAGSKQGIWAPAKTPSTIINLLNREIVRILNNSELKERLLALGIETAPSSPQQFSDLIKSEIEKTSKLIKAAGIKLE